MTKQTFFSGAAAAVLLVGSGGCESTVADLNNDPNNFTANTRVLALNQAQLNQASLAGAFPAHIAAMWADQLTGTDRQYITYDAYGIGNNDFDEVWLDIYQRGIVQAQAAKELSTTPALTAVATVLEAYYFGEAALMFGDVPFTQVNQITEFPDPIYDSQESVLRNAVALLDEAIPNLGTIAPTTTGRLIYTTTSTWAQVAQALKARYLLGLMDYDGAYTAAVASGMDTPAEDLQIASTTANFSENLWWQFEFEQRTTYLTIGDETQGLSYFQQLLSDTSAVSRSKNDSKTSDNARYNFFIQPGDVVADGVRYNISNGGWAAIDAPLPILTSAEVLLIRAEAALLKSTPNAEDARTALNAAREYWDTKLDSEDYEDFVAGDFATTDDLRRVILVEKYLSVIGLTAFYDLNRTNNLIGAPSEGGDPLAKRFFYPSTEESSNSNFPGVVPLATPLPLYQ